MKRLTLVTVVVGTLFGAAGPLGMLAGCGDSGGIDAKQIAKIEVSEGQRVVAPLSTITVSPDLPARLRVANTGTGALQIRDITITSNPPGAFTVTSLPIPSAEAPIEIYPDSLSHTFSVEFNPSAVAEGTRATATIAIHTNITINSGTEFTFNVAPESVSPKLVLSPPVLDFATVSANASVTKTVNVLNTGAADLVISRFVLGGSPGYAATIGGQTYNVDATSAAGITLSAPIVIASGNAEKVDVTYTAAGPDAAQGSLVFFSNDAGAPNGSEVKLYANLKGPCVKVNPSRVDFGAKLVGQMAEIQVELQSCGDVDLVVSDLTLVNDGGGVFGLDKGQVGAFPLTIGAGDSIFVPVTYLPTQVAQLAPGGGFVTDSGKMRVTSNAYLAELDVDLSGFGTDGSCPTANITVREGSEVLPQTVLHLSGLGSTANNGTVTGFQWTVVQPGGSVSTFAPSAFIAEPSFEANVVGEYIFRLKVFDSLGTESCSPAEYTVVVTSDDAIHVELLWRTPGDPNESDTGGDQIYFSAGSDVDLHFLHPDAYGRYFDYDYDCFWSNPTPEWGIFSPMDNPRLDRDDTDGGGPENLNVNVPEQGVRYQVGVHYWNDWGYGAAFATVRIYIYGQLRDQWADIRIVNYDMWDTHYIDWPSTQVTRITRNGGAKITNNYPVPGLF